MLVCSVLGTTLAFPRIKEGGTNVEKRFDSYSDGLNCLGEMISTLQLVCDDGLMYDPFEKRGNLGM